MLSRIRLYAVAPILVASASLCFSVGCNRDPNVRKQKYLASGQRFEKNGKLREATIQYLNALKIDHNFAEAHFELGKVYLRMGSINAAYNELSTTVDLQPGNLPARLALGNLEMSAGLAEQANEQVKAILKVNPNNPDGLVLRAGVEGYQNDHAAALADIQRALALDPKRPAFHVALALQESNDPAQLPAAMQEIRTAIQLDPTDDTPHMILGSMYERQKNYPAAIAEVQTAIKVAPKDLQGRKNLAGLYLRSGDRAQAEDILMKTAQEFQDDPEGARILFDYYVETGQLAQAERSYGTLSFNNPKSHELKFLHARLLVMLGQKDKAAKLAAELTKDTPNSPEVQILNSSLLLSNGKVDEAFRALQAAINTSPDDAGLQVALGRVALQKRDYDTALRSFREALRLVPNDLDAAAGIAQLADIKHDYEMMMQISQKTLARNPNFGSAYMWKATAEANLKQFDIAERDYQTAIAMGAADLPALIGLAQIRLNQGRVAEGTSMLERALQVDPASIDALVPLMRVSVAMHQPQAAVDRVQHQIDLVPGNAGLYNTLALLQASLKNYPAMREAALKSLEINPGDEQAVQYAATAETELGHPDAAFDLWQKWVSGHPYDADACTLAGQTAEQSGDRIKASAFYRRALQLAPGQAPLAENNLAFLLADNNGNLDDALSYAKQARSALPGVGGTADTLGWVYYKRGNYSLAKEQFDDALKANPNDADVLYHLGMTYTKLGNKVMAQANLRKASALANGSSTVKKANDALASLR